MVTNLIAISLETKKQIGLTFNHSMDLPVTEIFERRSTRRLARTIRSHEKMSSCIKLRFNQAPTTILGRHDVNTIARQLNNIYNAQRINNGNRNFRSIGY